MITKEFYEGEGSIEEYLHAYGDLDHYLLNDIKNWKGHTTLHLTIDGVEDEYVAITIPVLNTIELEDFRAIVRNNLENDTSMFAQCYSKVMQLDELPPENQLYTVTEDTLVILNAKIIAFDEGTIPLGHSNRIPIMSGLYTALAQVWEVALDIRDVKGDVTCDITRSNFEEANLAAALLFNRCRNYAHEFLVCGVRELNYEYLEYTDEGVKSNYVQFSLFHFEGAALDDYRAILKNLAGDSMGLKDRCIRAILKEDNIYDYDNIPITLEGDELYWWEE